MTRLAAAINRLCARNAPGVRSAGAAAEALLWVLWARQVAELTRALTGVQVVSGT